MSYSLIEYFQVVRLALKAGFIAGIFVGAKDYYALIFGSEPGRNGSREAIPSSIDFYCSIYQAAYINILSSEYQ